MELNHQTSKHGTRLTCTAGKRRTVAVSDPEWQQRRLEQALFRLRMSRGCSCVPALQCPL